MCKHGNSSHLSKRFVAAQLRALWENAQECVQYGSTQGNDIDLSSSTYHESQYVRALAEWYLPGKGAKGSTPKQDFFFAASFAEPLLDFVCNHEAVLRLKIKSGHMNTDCDSINKLSSADR
jgi:hypothetical protein